MLDDDVTTQARPRRSATPVVLLSLLSVLLLGAALLFGVLYSNQSSRNASLAEKVAEKQRGLDDTRTKIDANAKNLTKTQADIKSDVDARQKVEADSAPLAACYEAGRKILQNVLEQNLEEYRKNQEALYAAC
ncbi:hypothetical protein [Umezawaea sp. NPDC059074]|uniref:hypothetical protein n=1 Tax=Umezawaea sp. NPDC059074 TaxID=3346716 RepID=UPI0036818628